MNDWEKIYRQNETVWGEKPNFLLPDRLSDMPIGKALDLGMGSGSVVVWKCDLSHDYVSINGDYRS